MIHAKTHIAPTIVNNGTQPTNQHWLKELNHYKKVQLTISNQSNQSDQPNQPTQMRSVKIWAANQRNSLNKSTLEVSTGNYPQALLFNPVNQLIYVINQLDGSITIITTQGEKKVTLLLDQQLPGVISPVNGTVDPETGTTYIAASIQNKVYVIDLELKITDIIDVPHRPITLHFHTLTKRLYVGHLIHNHISIINPNTKTIIESIPVGSETRQILTHTPSGNWYVLDTKTNSIQGFSITNQFIDKLDNIAFGSLKALILPNTSTLIVIAKQAKEIISIDLTDLTITKKKSLALEPIGLTIKNNESILVLTQSPYKTSHPNQTIQSNQPKQSGELIMLDHDLTILERIEVNNAHQSILYLEHQDQLLCPLPIENKVIELNAKSNTKPTILFSENYKEVLTDFQYNPVLVKHVKVIYSAPMVAPIMTIGSKSPSGSITQRKIALNKYKSPQHFNSIYEVFEFENEIIDGRAFWEVLIPPNQQLTLLIYYH